MHSRKLVLFLGILSLFFAAGVSTPAEAKSCNKGSKIAGAVVGGVLGGILGNKIDGGRKRGFGTVVGAIGGSLLGSAIAGKLDKCEQRKVEAATLEAVNNQNGNAPPQSWKSDTRENVHGTITAAPPVVLADGRQCRTVTRVSYIAGEEIREQPRMCRVPPDVAWAVA